MDESKRCHSAQAEKNNAQMILNKLNSEYQMRNGNAEDLKEVAERNEWWMTW